MTADKVDNNITEDFLLATNMVIFLKSKIILYIVKGVHGWSNSEKSKKKKKKTKNKKTKIGKLPKNS
jgi:hypothetical protein